MLIFLFYLIRRYLKIAIAISVLLKTAIHCQKKLLVLVFDTWKLLCSRYQDSTIVVFWRIQFPTQSSWETSFPISSIPFILISRSFHNMRIDDRIIIKDIFKIRKVISRNLKEIEIALIWYIKASTSYSWLIIVNAYYK